MTKVFLPSVVIFAFPALFAQAGLVAHFDFEEG